MDYDALIDRTSPLHYINQILIKRPEDFPSLISVIEQEKKKRFWSSWLEEKLGALAAVSFAIGCAEYSRILDESISEMAKRDEGCILNACRDNQACEELEDSLPMLYRDRYTLLFLQKMRIALDELIEKAASGADMRAHSVAEEILLDGIEIASVYKAQESSENKDAEYPDILLEIRKLGRSANWNEGCTEWVDNLFIFDITDLDADDEDAEAFVSNFIYADFDHWFDNIFYLFEKNFNTLCFAGFPDDNDEDDYDWDAEDEDENWEDEDDLVFTSLDRHLVATYQYGDYELEITEDQEEYEAWLVKSGYGIKMHCFGGLKKDLSADAFTSVAKFNIGEYIDIYELNNYDI